LLLHQPQLPPWCARGGPVHSSSGIGGAGIRDNFGIFEEREARRLSFATRGIPRATFFEAASELTELRVLRFRLDEDRNVRVGVFPKREEILIGDMFFAGACLVGLEIFQEPEVILQVCLGVRQVPTIRR
jgi:hypothetical protein